jgi:hypothetical protein
MTDNRTEDERLAITDDEFVAQLDAEAAECTRVTRYWDTYNAAITGLLAANVARSEPVHNYASDVADRAHGPLEKRP